MAKEQQGDGGRNRDRKLGVMTLRGRCALCPCTGELKKLSKGETGSPSDELGIFLTKTERMS